MKYCDDRQALFFRGEVMGGGSRINGMVYTRGSAADYDTWAASGHPEWSYEKVLPYFVKGETSLNHPKSSYRGQSGEWDTARKTIAMIALTYILTIHRTVDYQELYVFQLAVQSLQSVS
jgi:choline dehydrogenase-like flavoprotein